VSTLRRWKARCQAVLRLSLKVSVPRGGGRGGAQGADPYLSGEDDRDGLLSIIPPAFSVDVGSTGVGEAGGVFRRSLPRTLPLDSPLQKRAFHGRSVRTFSKSVQGPLLRLQGIELRADSISSSMAQREEAHVRIARPAPTFAELEALIITTPSDVLLADDADNFVDVQVEMNSRRGTSSRSGGFPAGSGERR